MLRATRALRLLEQLSVPRYLPFQESFTRLLSKLKIFFLKRSELAAYDVLVGQNFLLQ